MRPFLRQGDKRNDKMISGSKFRIQIISVPGGKLSYRPYGTLDLSFRCLYLHAYLPTYLPTYRPSGADKSMNIESDYSDETLPSSG